MSKRIVKIIVSGNRFDNTKNKVMSVMVYSNEGRKYVSPVNDVGLH